MGLNNIQLPGTLLADLYKNNLVENHAQKPVANAADAVVNEKKTIQYLGKNQKGVCLLVNYPNDVYLPDEQLNFLTSILQACKLNLGDVAIVNFHQQKFSYTELKKEIKFKYFLVFGVEASALGLDTSPIFNLVAMNGCTIVYSPVAEQLNNNQPDGKALKSKLWISLKQLFAI